MFKCNKTQFPKKRCTIEKKKENWLERRWRFREPILTDGSPSNPCNLLIQLRRKQCFFLSQYINKVNMCSLYVQWITYELNFWRSLYNFPNMQMWFWRGTTTTECYYDRYVNDFNNKKLLEKAPIFPHLMCKSRFQQPITNLHVNKDLLSKPTKD